jgi:hypothetical protein
MREVNAQRETRNSMVKAAFGIMALVCLAAGLNVYLFAEQLGFSEDTARIVAIAFLVAGGGRLSCPEALGPDHGRELAVFLNCC